jgi:DNA-binding PadR family transcriptional regulator
MHGYQLMQAIAERSRGRWTPSPGAIYPTISQLEDEGLVTVTPEAGRKLVALTDAGREHLAARRDSWPDPFAGYEAAGPDLRALLEELHGAVRQVARAGTDAQVAAVAAVLAEARRSLYLLLADGPDAPDVGRPEDDDGLG